MTSFLILYKWGIFIFRSGLLRHHIMSRTILSFIFTYVHFSTNPFFCRELIFNIGLSQISYRKFCCGCKTSLEISLVNNDAIFSISLIYMLGIFLFVFSFFFFPHYWKIFCNIGCFIQKCEKIRIHSAFFPRWYKKIQVWFVLKLSMVCGGDCSTETLMMGWFLVDVISNL